MDRLAATRPHRFQAVTRDIPIVAVTVSVMDEGRDNTFGGGCDGFISKPVNPDNFGSQVAAYLRSNQGTTLEIQNHARTDAPGGAKETTDGSGGCVLVVDDTPTNVRLLTGILKMAGYEVVTAASGAEALAVLSDIKPGAGPDVVLLDVMMPDMDGFETCRRIKAAPATAYLPVVMVTALHEMPDRVRALEAGADDFLTKPVDEVEVAARVRSLVRVKRQRDDIDFAYAELRRAESQRDSLTAMLVHDLRTPLTAIIGPIEMLTAELAGQLDETQSELFTMCSRNAHRLLSLVNDLLDVSKMESGEMNLQLADTDPAHLIKDAADQLAPLAQKSGIELVRDNQPGMPTLRADADLLIRVLVNLLGNALKFTRRGGTITLSAHVNGEEPAVTFAVRDTGEGIPQESFERIFQKFGQVEGRQGGQTMSTGLGLTFCRMAVEAHGGRIWVESELGKGSTFSFTIPGSVE
jgi:signal transduction histidine kinase